MRYRVQALRPGLLAGFHLLDVTERHWRLTPNMPIKPTPPARRFFPRLSCCTLIIRCLLPAHIYKLSS